VEPRCQGRETPDRVPRPGRDAGTGGGYELFLVGQVWMGSRLVGAQVAPAAIKEVLVLRLRECAVELCVEEVGIGSGDRWCQELLRRSTGRTFRRWETCQVAWPSLAHHPGTRPRRFSVQEGAGVGEHGSNLLWALST
jgi:hypothetical protein